MSESLCQQIKSRLTLREAAQLCGIELPAKDGRKFCSPFRLDRHPSCEVFKDHIVDRSTGERLDCISLYATAKNLAVAEAIRELAGILNIRHGHAQGARDSFRRPTPAPSNTMKKNHAKFAALNISTSPTPPAMPPEIPWTKDLSAAIATSRGLPLGGIDLARHLGCLSAGIVHGFESWILSDRCAPGWESRRVDGQNYPATGDLGERKSHALGRIKSWPMGLCPPKFSDQDCQEYLPRILLVEGGPDWLSACCVSEAIREIDTLPCTMLGKGADIAEAALPFFKDREIVVAGHSDAGGRAQAWAGQLESAGGIVSVQLCPPDADLNDLIKSGVTPLEIYTQLFQS